MSRVTDELLRELDHYENQAIPIIEIDRNSLSFGTVQFKVSTTRFVVLENKGNVKAKFRFVPADKASRTVFKSWCNVEPCISFLLPGI